MIFIKQQKKINVNWICKHFGKPFKSNKVNKKQIN